MRRYLKELEKAGHSGDPPTRAREDQSLSPSPDSSEAGKGWPVQTGKICRSSTAIIAGQERPIWPVTLYKNTHLQILIYKKTQTEIRFFKIMKYKIQNAPRREDGLTEPFFMVAQ